MYKYDQYDHAMVQARVADFRDQTRRRIAGQLTDDQFKPLRLKNGLYLQLHAYMLRVAIPYGTLNGTQMRTLAMIAFIAVPLTPASLYVFAFVMGSTWLGTVPLTSGAPLGPSAAGLLVIGLGLPLYAFFNRARA